MNNLEYLKQQVIDMYRNPAIITTEYERLSVNKGFEIGAYTALEAVLEIIEQLEKQDESLCDSHAQMG